MIIAPLVFVVNENLKVECPSCWENTKLKHFQGVARDCVTGDSNIKVFCALTGAAYNAVEESNSEDLDAGLYQAVAFVTNQPQTFRDVAAPNYIKLRGKNILIPREIQRLTVGQNFQMRVEMSKAKNLESIISIAAAIYLQPLVDESKFNFERAKELEAEILEMNIFEIFPIGFFLLNRLNSSGKSGIPSLLRNLLARIKRMLPTRLSRASISLSLFMILLLSIGTLNTMASSRELSRKNPSMSLCLSSYSGNDKANSRTDFHFLKNL
jgi:hypothetical protein